MADSTRPPFWAGSFYPEDSIALRKVIHNLTNRVSKPATRIPDDGLKALILPHAGYMYSGLTMAHASLVLRKGQFHKVILLGPDHRFTLKNGAISAVKSYQTPLGDIALHSGAHSLRNNSTLFRAASASNLSEHSLEVVLPFLQYYLGSFELTPIILGSSNAQRISESLSPFMDPDTLLVVSTDLSHYLPYDAATAKDFTTINSILQLQESELAAKNNMACAIYALQTVIHLAQQNSWHPVLLHYSNSGDTAGNKEQVVGYAAIAFFANQDEE
jgi:AmmeMemoRadiSam system protein B